MTERIEAAPSGVPASRPIVPVRVRRRWVVVLAIALTAINLRGAATIFSPVSAEIAGQLRLNEVAVGFLGTMPQLLFALSGVIAPWLMERWALEKVTVLALVIAAAGQLARPFLGGGMGFLAFSAIVFVGIGIGNIVLPPLVKRYFPDRIGTMTGLYSALIPTSAAVPPLFVVVLAQAVGWRMALASWGLPALVAAAVWAWVWWRQMGALDRLRDRAQTGAADRSGAGTTDGTAPGATRPHGTVPGLSLWRSRVAWGMVGIMAPQSLIAYALFAWLPAVLRDAGFDAETASLLLSLFSGTGLALGFVVAPLTARLRRPYALVLVSTGLFATGLIGLAALPRPALPACVALVAVGPLTFNMALVLVNLRTRTGRGSAALSSFMQGLGYLFASAGPFAFGLMHAATGSWTAPLLFLAAVSLVQPLFGWWATRERFVEDEVETETTGRRPERG